MTGTVSPPSTPAAVPTSTAAWAGAIAHPAKEFPLTPLPLLSGSVPVGLRGSLYRNGPGRLERGGKPVGHWFDGDGAILAVHFTDDGVSGTYRYVRTAGYVVEDALNRFLYGGYGMTPPGMPWERWGKAVKNVANTSVLALGDRLLALWEGGHPHGLNLDDLATLGRDDLGGTLAPGLTYSAHPKRDAATGEIFNFGVALGLDSTLNLYRSDRTGAVQQHATVPLQGVPLVHDFVMAGRYLVFCIPPVQINLIAVGLGFQSFSDAMTWQSDRPTQILVLDRDTLSVVSRGEADPWFQWHFSNGYEDADGSIIVDVIRYQNFQINQFLREVATGRTQTHARGTFWRLRIQPETGQVLSQELLLDRGCEFPGVRPDRLGQQADAVFLNLHRMGIDERSEVFGAIARFNPETQDLAVADLGEGCYPSEPIFAPDPLNLAAGWVTTVVFDGNANRSELWVFDAHHLDDEPVCRLELPSIIPLGFHGTWRPAA